MGAWEHLVRILAADAGPCVPEAQTFVKTGTTFRRRFARNGTRRIPFVSAMATFGCADGQKEVYGFCFGIAGSLMRHGTTCLNSGGARRSRLAS